jgi:Protein of unknown function (DUF1559)
MSRRAWILVFLTLLGGLCLAFWLVEPHVQKVRNGDSWGYSATSVKQISMALLAYQDAYKKLPPAVVKDKDGRPLYSWRVLLLPFLEENLIYKQFKRDEPWDSPHNKELLATTPPCYQPFFTVQNISPGKTHYQLFIGPGTAFERPGLHLARDFPDGPGRTILVVESATPVWWSKPEDVTYDPKGPLPPLGGLSFMTTRFLRFETHHPDFVAGDGDGGVRFIRGDTDESIIRALITRNGGEAVDLSDLK